MKMSAGESRSDERPADAADEPRLRILRAAARVLAVEGYDGARLRSVAREAGVSVGMLQHYFDTRDALMSDAVTWATSELLAHWTRPAGERRDPWQQLTALLESLTMRDDLRSRSMAWTEFCASSARHPELRPAVKAVYDEWRRLMTDVIQAGIDSGVFRPALPAADVADVLVAQVDGCELAVAADVGMLDGSRFRDLVLAAAAVLLGVSPALAAPRTAAHPAGTPGGPEPAAGVTRIDRTRRRDPR